MEKHGLRNDKTCLNCGAYVSKRFCPKCGQENRDSHMSFTHLVYEFIVDFVHFDSSFWKTTKDLLFSPAKLSLAYTSGKRKSFVDPIKLYIFISFITFFIPAFLPSFETEEKNTPMDVNIRDVEVDDMMNNFLDNHFFYLKSVSELDSVNSTLDKKISYFEYTKSKLVIQTKENIKKNIREQNQDNRVLEFMIHSFPKVLFIYMPIFAFWIWLFNLNRRKYYFDSGIFTLHLFSFILLMITIFNIVSSVLGGVFSPNVNLFLFNIGLLYVLFYFFRANRIFYSERRWLTVLKGASLILINLFLILIILCLYFIFALAHTY